MLAKASFPAKWSDRLYQPSILFFFPHLGANFVCLCFEHWHASLGKAPLSLLLNRSGPLVLAPVQREMEPCVVLRLSENSPSPRASECTVKHGPIFPRLSFLSSKFPGPPPPLPPSPKSDQAGLPYIRSDSRRRRPPSGMDTFPAKHKRDRISAFILSGFHYFKTCAFEVLENQSRLRILPNTASIGRWMRTWKICLSKERLAKLFSY